MLSSELPMPPKPKRCWSRNKKYTVPVPTKWYIRWHDECQLVRMINFYNAPLLKSAKVSYKINADF